MKSSAEIEAEVEASRNDLDRNVEALKQKMTPGQLFDETARLMGGTSQQVASKFVEQAKANPMPLALVGLGLAWLMVSNTRSSGGAGSSAAAGMSSSGGEYGLGEARSFAPTPFEQAAAKGSDIASGLGERAGDAADSLKEKAQGLGEKAKGLLSGVQDKISQARSSASDGGSSVGEGLSAAVGTVRDKASQVGQHAQRTFLDTLESEPLLLAGLGVIVGAAVGAALPRTDAEDRMLGQTRDRLLQKGRDLAQSGVDKAAGAAQATYGAVKSELQSSGDEGREPAERLADAARSGVQAAQEHLQGSAH